MIGTSIGAINASLIAGNEPENWRQARAAGVDALLTDFPLDCRRAWKKP